MPYTVQNPNVFTAAFSGAVAGMGISGRIINQSDSLKYSGLVAVASAFAQSLDTIWGTTAIASLEQEVIQESCEALWQERAPVINANTLNPDNWNQECHAIVAVVNEALALYTSQGYPNPPIGGGSGTVQSVNSGFGIFVDNTDPINPIVNLATFTINSFTTPITLLEAGNTLVNPTFAATYNQTPDSASIIDNQGNPALPLTTPFTAVTYPHSYTKTIITSVTWTLSASKFSIPATRNVAAAWGFLNYHGAADDPGVVTAAFVQSLSSAVLATSRVIPNFSQTVSGTQFLWYCYPTSEGTAVLFDNTTGFQIDMTTLTTTLAVTNTFGVTVNYTVMRSTFQLNTTIVVRVT